MRSRSGSELISGDASKTRKGKDKANGHVNGISEHLDTPAKSTNKVGTPAKSPKTPSNNLADEDTDAEEISASVEKGKKRGKKRKAPKEA